MAFHCKIWTAPTRLSCCQQQIGQILAWDLLVVTLAIDIFQLIHQQHLLYLIAIRHQIGAAPQAIPHPIVISQFKYIPELTAFLLRLGLGSLVAIQVSTRGLPAVATGAGQGRQRLASRQ